MSPLNPKTAPALLLIGSILLLGGAAAVSGDRLTTVATEQQNNSIAQYRAEICRITTEDLELGGYYFQPTQTTTGGALQGTLLSEGTYLCSALTGESGRIERGGYLLYLVTPTDVSGIVGKLRERLKDPNNPDSAELSRVRRASNLGTYQPPAQSAEQPQFFQP